MELPFCIQNYLKGYKLHCALFIPEKLKYYLDDDLSQRFLLLCQYYRQLVFESVHLCRQNFQNVIDLTKITYVFTFNCQIWRIFFLLVNTKSSNRKLSNRFYSTKYYLSNIILGISL